MSAAFPPLLARLLANDPVGREDMRAAFDAILAGKWTPVQVGAFAVALRMRGETAEQIVAAAEAMRAAMTPVEHALPVVVDTCGTGGDGAHTLNLSSASALVVAASGFAVAKHGNRSVSSRCGSADVVEALGVAIDVPAARQGEVLREAGIAFHFAPAHHPAMKHAGQARNELGARTIFNALGPLANPARATHQLVGVYDDALRAVAARALGQLGTRRAWVVRSEDGLDEVSPSAPTRVSELTEDGKVRERIVAPEDFGVARASREAIAGGDAKHNARALVPILEGEAHPALGAVVLNAAAAIAVASGDPLRASAERARSAIDSRAARGDARAVEACRRAREGSMSRHGVLGEILACKRREIEALGRERAGIAGGMDREQPGARPSASSGRRQSPGGRDVVETLRRGEGDPLRLLAEVKLRSPSAGVLSRALTPDARAVAYAEAGASMVSILCDSAFFDGSWEHLSAARRLLDAAALQVPLLGQEFVLDESEIALAGEHGADSVLLIARIVDSTRLAELVRAARAEGLEPLVEVVDEDELRAGLDAGARLVGVNARDLDTLAMDAARTARVLAAIPREVVAVHLSGLRRADDVAAVARTRADAALIGEALMREDDPRGLLREMVSASQR